MKIVPVILCGGSGTRLWPLSRAYSPKQLISLSGNETLLQETMQRVERLAAGVDPIVICNTEHRFLVKEQLQASNPKIILEPFGRNTAPAIAIAALQAASDDAVLLVLPSDHLIKNRDKFEQIMDSALEYAGQQSLVTFGIVPDRPATGYGYIKAKEKAASAVDEFVEKPDLPTAEQYLKSGDYYWNSGMFMFKASSILNEMSVHAPEVLEHAKAAYAGIKEEFGFLSIPSEIFQRCPDISIDYAIMEKTDKAVVLPMDIGWSDLGSWQSLWDVSDKDTANNVVSGDVQLKNVQNSYIYANNRLVTAIDVENIVVVDTRDALLVVNKDKSQNVKHLVDELRKNKREEVDLHRKVLRPWGSYETLEESECYKVKRLTVTSGARLSLQSHKLRAEHWVVVQGIAKVTCGEKVFDLHENQSTYIPIGEIHRLENKHDQELIVIEVQSGTYLGEDDITRYEDKYGR